jgi:hypothetical protein
VATSPTLTSVSPASVTAGGADVQITLLGSNFTAACEVSWNNQQLAITSVTDTQIVASVPSSAMVNAAASSIIVTNGPGTAPSSPVPFNVLPDLGPNASIAALNLSGRDLAWDAQRGLLYVAVPITDPIFPSTIAVVDPATVTIRQTVPTVPDPRVFDLSDDGQFLYSGSNSSATVQRYTLPSFAIGLTIPTGAGAAPGAAGTVNSCTFPVEVKVAPGHPQEIAVTSGNVNIETIGCGGMAIYDGAVVRPNLPNPYLDFTNIAWGADDTTLFGQTWQGIMPQSLLSALITPQGVGKVQSINGGGLGARVHYDAATNLLYSDSGVITDPVHATQVGAFPSGGLVTIDSARMRAYILTATTALSPTWALQIYNLSTRALLDTIAIPSISGYPVRMTRWGADGIAFVTVPDGIVNNSAGALYILHGSRISGGM